MVKNIYLATKIKLLQCQGAELHLEVALDHVVGIVVGVHRVVLKPVPINSAGSKTCIWTPRSTFHELHLEVTLDRVVAIIGERGLTNKPEGEG